MVRVDHLINRELEQMRDGSVASRRLTSDIPTLVLKINSDLSTTFDYLYLIPTD